MSAKEEAAALRGVMQSIVVITASATDAIARAAHELAKQGLSAADKVSEKRDQNRARWREWNDRRKRGATDPPAFDPHLQSVCSPFAAAEVFPPDPPSSSSSPDSSFLSDSGEKDPSGLRASARENGANGTPAAFVLAPTNATTNANAKVSRRKPETLPADPADASAWAAWCARWKLDARSADVVTFANWHLGKEVRWRDWSRAWADWTKKPANGARRSPPPVQPPPANGQRIWKAGDGQ